MRAVIIVDGPQGPVLQPTESPVPVAGPGEILIRMRAAGVNRADLVRAKTHFGSDSGGALAIAGMEVAGEVQECGPGATRFKAGDAVIAMAPRSYAEFCTVHESIASPVPEGMDWPHALACCTSYITAHNALATAGLKPGETVLIQGAGASAGIALVELAAQLGASVVAGTSSKSAKLDRLSERGLTLPLLRDAPDALEKAMTATGGRGFDIIIDNVGRGALDFNMRAISVLGRIISVGRLGGNRDELDIDELARKRVSFIGVTFRTRSREEHAAVVAAYERDLMPMFASGALRPVVDKVFPLEEAMAAQEYMKQDTHFGKIVLSA